MTTEEIHRLAHLVLVAVRDGHRSIPTIAKTTGLAQNIVRRRLLNNSGCAAPTTRWFYRELDGWHLTPKGAEEAAK